MPLLKKGPTLLDKVVQDAAVYQIDQIPESCQKDYEKVNEVGIAVKVLSISGMDMAAGTFSADVNVNICWKGDKDSPPVIQFYNCAEDPDLDPGLDMPKKGEERQSTEVEVKKGKNGWDWFYRVRCRGSFRQAFDLHKFPFDTQDLKIDVRLKKACRLTHVAWAANGDAVACDPRAVSDDFDLLDAKVVHTYLPSYKFGGLGGYDPEGGIVFTVCRKPLFWIVSYGLMASVICSLMACTYAIPADSVSDRLGVAMTLVLTISATKYLMMEKLPGVAYFTLLDMHIFICCLFLTFMTLEVSLAEFVGAELLGKFEKFCFLPLCTIGWAGYHVYVYRLIYFDVPAALRFL